MSKTWRLNKKAMELFSQEQYSYALENFYSALMLDSQNKQAKIGVMLCDMTSENREQALALFEFYQVLLCENRRTAHTKILDLIKSMDANASNISEMITNIDTSRIDSIDGVLYEDFKKAIIERGDFREAFEDLRFSTKIIFTKKSDFYDFLDLLIENDLEEMSIEYIERMRNLFGFDQKTEDILQKVAKKQK